MNANKGGLSRRKEIERKRSEEEKTFTKKRKIKLNTKPFLWTFSSVFRFRLRFSFVYSFRIEEQTDKTTDALSRAGVRRERDGERSNNKNERKMKCKKMSIGNNTSLK